MRYLKVLSLCGLLLAWGMPSQAAQLVGLYEAEVQVADQGRETRSSGMSEAMAAVLLKVSGSSAVLAEEMMQSAMADATRYVQQYRYRSEGILPQDRKPAADGKPGAESRLWLWVGFDSASIDNLLRRFGFSVWSAARPATLVWLGVEEGKHRVLVGANDQGLVREVLDAEAQRRAIPLRLPLLDLADQSRVRPVDIWGGFVDHIEEASQRYEPQAVLIGKLYPVSDGWEARWILRYKGQQYEWQLRASEVTAVIASGVGSTSDYLSQRFSESSYLGVNELVLRVEGVAGMGDFRRVNDYLLSLHGVAAVTLRRVEATASSFLLKIEGGREAVLQAINLGAVLVKVATPVPQSPLSPMFSAPTPATPLPRSDAVPQPAVLPLQPSVPLMEQTGPADDAVSSPQQPPVVPLQELVYRLLP